MALSNEHSDAYASGYYGDPEPAGLSAGGHGAYKLGKDDRAAGRDKATSGEIEKSAHKATSLSPRANAQRRKDIAADQNSEGATAHTPAAGGSPTSEPAEGGEAPQSPRSSLLAGRFSSWGDGGGLLMAVFLYPIVLAMLTRGPGGMKAWLNAKFLNKVSTTPPLTASGLANAGAITGAVATGGNPLAIGGLAIGAASTVPPAALVPSTTAPTTGTA